MAETVVIMYTYRYAKFWLCTCAPICTCPISIWYIFLNIRVVCLRLTSPHLYLETQLFSKVEGSPVYHISCVHLPIYSLDFNIRLGTLANTDRDVL